MDTDVVMVPAGEGSSIGGPSSKKPKRFEIKKWNAVALWAWGNLTHLYPNFFFPTSPFHFRKSSYSILQILSLIIVRFAAIILWIYVSSFKYLFGGETFTN